MDIDLLNQSITEKLIGDCFLQVSTKVQVVIVDTHFFDIWYGFLGMISTVSKENSPLDNGNI